jgi:hypothetical protein
METKKLKSLKKVNDYEERIDLEQFIIESQNVKHKEQIKKEFKTDKKGTISKEQSLQILGKYQSSKSDELIDCISESDNESIIEVNQEKISKDKAIDFCNDLFKFAGKKFSYIVINEIGKNGNLKKNLYIKGKDVAEYLGYENTSKALSDHVNEKYKFKFEEFFRGNETLPLKNSKPIEKKLTWNEKNTIYISEPGLYSLLTKSEKEKAEPFQDFIFEELLPSLRKTGSYNLSNKISFDTSFISSFYDENNISDYIDCNVVYLGVIGMYESGLLCKYGLSKRIFERDYEEHRKNFGDQFKIISVIKNDNNIVIEEKFKKEMKIRGIDRKLLFNGKEREELFVTNDKFKLQDAKDLMKKIADANPLESIKDRDNKIKELEYKFNNDKEIIIEKEKTKQIKLKLKLLKLKMKKNISSDSDLYSDSDSDLYSDSDSDSKSKPKLKEKIEVKPILKPKEENEKSKLDVLIMKENKSDDEIKQILQEYFEHTNQHTDVVKNSVVDEYSHYLNIKKNKIIEYLRNIGGQKYKCNSTQGHREIKIKKEISEHIKMKKIK